MENYTIIAKEQLSANVFQMRLYAPAVAKARKPGQFILLSLDEDYGERIPLTIADADEAEGSITIIFQTVGYTTTELSKRAVGERLAFILGPLGRPTAIGKVGRVVCVGGGIANEGENLLARVRAIVEGDRYSKHAKVQTQILKAELGNNAGVIGAALLDE